MTNAGKVVLIAFLALTVPPLVCVATHWDTIVRMNQVDPASAQGHLLYFTAPG